MSNGAPPPLSTIPTAVLASRWNGTILAGFSRAATGSPADDLGLYRWQPALESWQRLATAFSGAEITMLAQNPECADQVFVGTNGGLELVKVTD